MNLNLPFAKDHANNDKPSVTLLFAYVSFLLALGMDIALGFKDLLAAVLAAIVLFVISIALYRMRRLDKLKISRSSVEIDSSDSGKVEGRD